MWLVVTAHFEGNGDLIKLQAMTYASQEVAIQSCFKTANIGFSIHL